MKLKKKWICIAISIVIIVLIGIIALWFTAQNKKTADLDTDLQFYSYPQFMEYLYETENVTQINRRSYDQRLKERMDDCDVSAEDTFFVVEFTPENGDDRLDKLVLAACMNEEGKIFPLNYGTALLRDDRKEYGHQCLYHMTFYFTSKNQIQYDIEGRITNYRPATQSARVEDDVMICERTLSENVHTYRPLEKEDILLKFHCEGVLEVKTQ